MVGLGGGSAAATVARPAYLATIGLGSGSGHAEIYPGGVTVDASGNVYVADTGNDQVKAYWPNGAVRWTVGTRGPKSLNTFDNPRDIAFLNGKLDLAQAESVADVIEASTATAVRAAARSLTGEFSRAVHAFGDALIDLRTYTEATLVFPAAALDLPPADADAAPIPAIRALPPPVGARARRGRWVAGRSPGVEDVCSGSDGPRTRAAERIAEVHEWLLTRF